MPSNKDYTELIENYLDGELSEKERVSFEQKLATNPELQQELEFYELAYAGIVNHKFSEVEDVIKEVKQEYVTAKKRKRIKNHVIGTALMVLSGTGLFYVLKDTPSEKEYIQKQEISIDSVKEEDSKENEFQPEKKEFNQPVENTLTETSEKPEKIVLSKKTNKTVSQPVEVNDTVLQPEKNKKENTIDNSATTKKEAEPAAKIQEPFVVQKGIEMEHQNDPIPCETTHIAAVVKTEETCMGSTVGRITILETKGGNAPYEFELSTGETSSQGRFANLEAGVYTVFITDHNDCSQILENIAVKEKLCKLNLHFDPSSGQPLVFPEYEKAGQLAIFDKQGTQKFNDKIEFHTAYKWFGNSNSGALAPGYYLFQINFEDGTVQNGSITITP